jgi:hypothetical protein
MQQIQQRVIEVLQTLSPVDQQEVLDFVEFLRSKRQNELSPLQVTEQPQSALEIAGDLVGCLEGGPSDLSVNKKYLEGFGQE